MAVKTYKILDQLAIERLQLAGAEVGDARQVDLDHHQERAVVAAGWLELVEQKPAERKPAGKEK